MQCHACFLSGFLMPLWPLRQLSAACSAAAVRVSLDVEWQRLRQRLYKIHDEVAQIEGEPCCGVADCCCA